MEFRTHTTLTKMSIHERWSECGIGCTILLICDGNYHYSSYHKQHPFFIAPGSHPAFHYFQNWKWTKSRQGIQLFKHSILENFSLVCLKCQVIMRTNVISNIARPTKYLFWCCTSSKHTQVLLIQVFQGIDPNFSSSCSQYYYVCW